MNSPKRRPHGDSSKLFPTIAAASTVALAGQVTPRMAWITYIAILVYAAVVDFRSGRDSR